MKGQWRWRPGRKLAHFFADETGGKQAKVALCGTANLMGTQHVVPPATMLNQRTRVVIDTCPTCAGAKRHREHARP